MNRIKNISATLLVIAAIAIPIAASLSGCKSAPATTAYQSIATTEAGVIAANGGYLDSVVMGLAPTNGVPAVEAAFNDTQLALHTAAVIASGGSTAATPPAVFAKAVSFTNTIAINSVKH